MIRADLHIHSCLSPCGDDTMTPFDLVGMSLLNGLDLIALTDHNTAKNCPAAMAAAREYGIGFIPGMEVTTAEDVHCVCLFPTLESALDFDSMLEKRIPPIKNKTEIFGNQIIMSPNGDEKQFDTLLITATDISIMELPALVREYGGICYPAHVDRESNGLLAVLGLWPEDLDVTAAEVRFKVPDVVPKNLKILQASDAHRLEALPEGGFPIDAEEPTFEGIKTYIGG
jgi:PHP family Zn ribbon phosphoesterase